MTTWSNGVFYSWFREDSDRETTENLFNVRPE